MDHARFDTLARRVFGDLRQSRRAAVATLLGFTLLRQDRGQTLAKPAGKTNPQSCYRKGTSCTPGQGANASRCDFSSSTNLVGRDFRGANLSKSNFTGAQLPGADFRGANLSRACLVGANLLDAKLGASVNLRKAVFCGTLMPDGSRNDRDCEQGTACCPTGCEGGECGDGCVGFNQVCSILSPLRCCGDTGCTVSIVPGLTSCQFHCLSNLQCADRFPNLDLTCVDSPGVCTFIGRCCRPKQCATDADCPRSGRCCTFPVGESRCCI
jgi:hypothetical protein